MDERHDQKPNDCEIKKKMLLCMIIAMLTSIVSGSPSVIEDEASVNFAFFFSSEESTFSLR